MSIFKRFSNFSPHYFQKRLSRRLEELYMSVAMLDFALAAATLFEPVYLYQLGYTIQHILLFYAVVYGIYFFLAPLGGKFVARFGPERSIAISTIMQIMYYAGLLMIKGSPQLFWAVPVFFSLQKMFYWPAYHTDFIMTSDQGQRGKEFSGLWSLSTMMNILGPLVGGVIVAAFGFTPLFLGAISLVVLSNIPLFIDPVEHTPQKFSYWASLKMPFSRYHVKTMLAYLGFGEEFVLQFIWPIFLVLMVKNYVSLGGLIAVATFITALVTLYVGRIVDSSSPRRALAWGTVVTAAAWLTRPWLRMIGLIFVNDTFGRIAKNTTYVTLTAMTYERALQEKNIIPRAVFYEQGFALAKTLAPALIIVTALVMPIFTAAFIIAGLMSLLYFLF